jgi:hypothetical protein
VPRLEEGRATKSAVLEGLRGRRVVFLMAHGYYDPPFAAKTTESPPERASGLTLADGPSPIWRSASSTSAGRTW